MLGLAPGNTEISIKKTSTILQNTQNPNRNPPTNLVLVVAVFIKYSYK